MTLRSIYITYILNQHQQKNLTSLVRLSACPSVAAQTFLPVVIYIDDTLHTCFLLLQAVNESEKVGSEQYISFLPKTLSLTEYKQNYSILYLPDCTYSETFPTFFTNPKQCILSFRFCMKYPRIESIAPMGIHERSTNAGTHEWL